MSGIDLALSDETKLKVALKEAMKDSIRWCCRSRRGHKIKPHGDRVRAGGALRRNAVYRLCEASHILS